MPDPAEPPPDPAGSSSLTPSLASAPPLRAAGTRSRAGNAMARTRAGLLDGARRAVIAHGTRRATMHDIATFAGVAKATLYNHFRTKDDVWAALMESEVRALAEECAGRPLTEALGHAARRLSEHEALRRVVVTEPVVAAALLTGDRRAPAWQVARAAVRQALGGREGDDLVLRWLGSYLVTPGAPDAIAACAAALVRGLPAG